MAAHSSILAWEVPWTREPDGLHTVHGVAEESDTAYRLPRNVKEETELGSSSGQAAHIRLHTWSPSQWTLNFVSSVYRNGIPMGNQTPG